MTGFQRLLVVTCLVVFGLIVLGGVVRATGSGLGCPDWPRCHGSLVPRWEKEVLIEYSHRLVASVAGVLVLATAAWAAHSYRRAPAVLLPAVAAFVVLLVQAGLGGVTVLKELPPEIVTVHLAMALTLLALLLLTLLASLSLQRPAAPLGASRNFARLALLAAATAFGLMLVGAFVAGSGYGLACSGWPLCNGEVVPSTEAASVQTNFLHRFLALTLGIMLATLAYLGWRERRKAPIAAAFAGAALVVYLGQGLVGASNVWTRLDTAASAGHLAVATLLWTVLALLNLRLYGVVEMFGRRRPQAISEAELARAAR
jgi:heme A synthase